jgi:hypothetical protein
VCTRSSNPAPARGPSTSPLGAAGVTRRKPYPPRPEKPFRVGAVQWNLHNVANHVRAGFSGVSDDTVRLHYYRYLDFLQRHGYTLRTLATNLGAVGPETTLWSTDLTPRGYRFVQFSHDRWIGRILKYADSPRENAYLDRWHAKFLELPLGTFADAGDT